ncbi:molybdopterin oxidoreductase [Alcanivorax sp. N3-2A]|nr:molybdopterin oxidoreductase [Alcanivorax sp. N3-2A]|tara:strand:- start:92778 stop:95801 length:3024 start_codon:yes stop_codon:yes gene_type:complete
MPSIIARQSDHIDIAELRRRLAGRRGRPYWRSLEELADAPGFQQLLEEEFPRLAPLWQGRVSRRGLLGLMAASLALGGLSACKPQPAERIAPYTRRPEDLIPGQPRWYASALTLDGYARGVLVKTFEGRPVKIEGLPLHPASLGATDSIAQAEILGLYDPDRSQAVHYQGNASGYHVFLRQLRARAARWGGDEHRLCLLTGPVSSPSQLTLIESLRQRYPGLRWYSHQPVSRQAVYQGTRQAFGEALEPRYRLHQARVVLTLDADLLGQGGAKLAHARALFGGRRPAPRGPIRNRLYCIESTPTITGASSDHRLGIEADRISAVAAALAARLGVPGLNNAPTPSGVDPAWLDALAADLEDAGAHAVVIAGDHQPASLHALTHLLNHRLGAIGTSVDYAEPVLGQADGDLTALSEAIDQGNVDGLLMLGTNPLYSAPPSLQFEQRLARVPFTVHCGQYRDETGRAALWHLPLAHPLESWDDARAFDGSVALMQPTIVPMFGGFTAQQVLASFAGDAPSDARQAHRNVWRRLLGDHDFDARWRAALQRGWLEDSASAARTPKSAAQDVAFAATLTQVGDDGLILQLRPDPVLHDGHYANNGWLQELPRPITQLTWDGAALIAPALAEKRGLREGEKVTLALAGQRLSVPVWIQPGQPADAVTLFLGQGRRAAGRVGNGVGVNASELMASEGGYDRRGLTLHSEQVRWPLASTQQHHAMEGRDVLREATLEEFHLQPDFAQPPSEAPISLYPEHDYPGHAWGMSVDLSSCFGCNACITACQAENNIPIVGKEEVMRGREMHWLRVDRYFSGAPDAPRMTFQPVPCMHCEKAPCEYVCPVEATQHSSEGLNDMVYNRCVGTRYCSQNCPYKVRRFNWFHYTAQDTGLATPAAAHNPDVTVRSRGVMEKCTYCVQRINQAHIQARNENRDIADGEVTTACQQVCPSQAITFGDINDPRSAVSTAKASPLNYAMLGELNTRPRTTYLAGVRNPNPAIDALQANDAAGGEEGPA